MKKETLRERIRHNAWSAFCHKSRRHLSDDQIVKIILKKAQKTYPRYVSLCEKNQSLQLECIVISNHRSRLLNFYDTFLPVIQRAQVQKQYDELLGNMQIVCDSLWDKFYQHQRQKVKSAA